MCRLGRQIAVESTICTGVRLWIPVDPFHPRQGPMTRSPAQDTLALLRLLHVQNRSVQDMVGRVLAGIARFARGMPVADCPAASAGSCFQGTVSVQGASCGCRLSVPCHGCTSLEEGFCPQVQVLIQCVWSPQLGKRATFIGCAPAAHKHSCHTLAAHHLRTSCALVAQTTDRCALGYEPHGNVRGQVPKRYIGGSGIPTCAGFACAAVVGDSLTTRLLGFSPLDSPKFWVMPRNEPSSPLLLLGLMLCLCLGVVQLLAGVRCFRLPARRRLSGEPIFSAPARCARCLCVASPARPVFQWCSDQPKPCRRSRVSLGIRLGPLLAWVVGGSLPRCVWAAPEGLAEVAQLAEDVDTARRIVSAASAGSSGPDPLPVTEGVPSRRAPDFVDRALQLPRGPPPPCPMCVEIDNAMQHTVPAVVEEVPFSIWVGAPGYQPQVLQFQLGLPCDIEDALEATARHIKATKPPFYDRVAVKPQPFHTCAAAILTPDWASYSALSLVCLDLRDAVPEGLGPVVPVFVTRPTSRAELLREAGIYGVAPLNVFVGTDPLPVQDDESIVLANGCLVTFLRRGCCPNSVNDLQYRLQYPRIWDVPAQFPKQVTGQTSLLLLLHRTGTYLLRTKALTDTPHEAVARFVGVEHESVTFHTPSDDALRNFVHKGVDVRGVIALVTKAEVDPVAVFLDLRQIGGGVRYVALAQPHIPFADLNGYAGRSPPPSWHVQVHGGRRQHDSLAVCSGETLVFGFQHVDPDSTLWSPPSLPDDDDDEEEDADHDEDEEEESDDSSDSAATTRSRSRGRARRGPGDREPSSDHSYQGGLDAVTFPFEGFQGWLGVPTSRTDGATSAASTISAGGTVYAVSGCNKPVPAVLHSGSQSAMYEGASSAPEPVGLTSFACVGFTGAGVRCIVSADFPGALGSGPENFLDSLRLRVRVGAVRGLEPIESLPTQTSALKYAVAALLSRFLAEPSTTTPAAREALDALRRITGALGGPWPLDGPGRLLPLEPGETEAQPTDAGAQLAATHKRIAVCVLVPDYVAEHHTIRLQLPATPAEFQQTLEQARLPEVTMRFPYLVAALPQPRHGMGVFVGLPHWDCSAAVVCMDMTAIDGRLYAAVAPAYADRAILCDIADLPEAASVHIYVGVGSEPVEGEAWAHLVPGITVSFRPHGVDFQPGPSLDVRLLSADGWQEEAEEIGPNADGVYCLVFGHRHRRFLSDPGDPLHYRQRLAAAIGADSQRLCIAPAVPRVPDIAIDGAPCRTALAVALPEAGVASPQLVLVDCRPLFEGWVCWRAYNGRLLTQELLQDLRFSTPVGYDVEVSGARVDGAHLLVGPGCVLTADFVKREVSGLHRSPTSIQEPSPGSAIETTTHDAALGPVSVGEITSQPPVSVPDVGERAALNYTSVSAVGRALSVLVAVPSYLAELHEVTITPPVTPQNFVEQVHARRSATDVRRFPRLVEVAPQPDKQFAMFVALPAWPTVLCTICIDARRYDGRLFAVSAPVVVDLASLRTIVDIPADANVRIFMRDVPWPVEAGAPLGLSPGDLFTVLPHDGTFPQVAGLRDVLNTFSVPEPSDAFAGDYGDRAWLVTDSEPILYEVDRRRGIHVRADVAAAIGTSVETLVLCSARPRIHDFADQGRLVRTVMLALARPFPGETASEPLTPLLLDMRPIALGFVAAFARDRGYDVAGLARSLTGFCPPGFCVVVHGGQHGQPLPHVYRHTEPGEVLVVEFHPARAESHGHAQSPASVTEPVGDSAAPHGSGNPGDGPPGSTGTDVRTAAAPQGLSGAGTRRTAKGPVHQVRRAPASTSPHPKP